MGNPYPSGVTIHEFTFTSMLIGRVLLSSHSVLDIIQKAVEAEGVKEMRKKAKPEICNQTEF